MRVLVVEDDPVISSELVKALTRDGHKVDAALDGEEGLTQAFLNSYGLIILDIMLPKRNGWEVCADLRKSGLETPILMLTAKDEIDDRVKGLDLGADDYLVKPFDLRELKARIRALGRRDSARKSGIIEVADLVIDSKANTVSRSGEPIPLTPREFSLLEALARHEGQILTRDAILERVWNNDESLPNTVNFHMSSLRRKIDAERERKLIQTVHGMGYVLRSGDEG